MVVVVGEGEGEGEGGEGARRPSVNGCVVVSFTKV